MIVSRKVKTCLFGLLSSIIVVGLALPVQAQDAEDADLEPAPAGASTGVGGAQTGSEPAGKPKKKKKPPAVKMPETSEDENPSASEEASAEPPAADPNAAPAEPPPPSPEELARQELERQVEKLPEPLKKLALAKHVYDTSAGGSDEYTAAFKAAISRGAGLRDDLIWIAKNGSPAGRIYAALLIKQFDNTQGTALLLSWKDDKTMVVNKRPGSEEHYSVSEIVSDLMSKTPIIKLTPR